MSGDGLQTGSLIFIITLSPDGDIEAGAPAELVLPHRSVEIGGCAVSEAVVRLRIKFLAVVGIIHQVTAKTQKGRQLPDVIDVTYDLTHG